MSLMTGCFHGGAWGSALGSTGMVEINARAEMSSFTFEDGLEQNSIVGICWK